MNTLVHTHTEVKENEEAGTEKKKIHFVLIKQTA